MKNPFHENMTYSEARRVLFTAVEGKSPEEIEELKKAYAAVLPVITKRELRENDGYMTSDHL